MVSRRLFIKGASALAFTGLAACRFTHTDAIATVVTSKGLGPLISDKNELLDLPEGFNYQVISKFGDLMNDGLHVPDFAEHLPFRTRSRFENASLLKGALVDRL